jgi:hypothetical protein
VAANVLEWGTGAINVDGCRVGHDEPLGPSAHGMAGKQAGIMGKTVLRHRDNTGPAPQGRWPANLILSYPEDEYDAEGNLLPNPGSDEVLAGFPVTTQIDKRQRKIQRQPPGQNGIYGTFEGADDTPAYGDTGSAARFFKNAPQDVLCALCNYPISDSRGIMNGKGDTIPCAKSANNAGTNLSRTTTTTSNDSAAKNVLDNGQQSSGDKPGPYNERVNNAAQSTEASQARENTFAQTSAEQSRSVKIAQNVKSAGNLCDSCTISIAQSLVAMQQDQSPESILGQAFIPVHKKQILTQCLASFVAILGNTDIIPTTESLSLLFGSVYHAIESYTASQSEIAANQTRQPNRLKYSSKASKRDRNEGCEGLEARTAGHYAQDEWSRQHMGNTPDAKRQPVRNHHPTVKPTALMQYLCRLITPPGGLVLDPFMGSGSTGKGAILEGFRFIGIEQDAEYIEIARRRIEWAFQQAHPTTGEFVTKAGKPEDTDGLPMFGGEQ